MAWRRRRLPCSSSLECVKTIIRFVRGFSSLSEQPSEGAEFGPYRLGPLLGEGAMAHVFRAVKADDGSEVALKVLKADLSGDDTYRRRFVHEARTAAGVRHEHLVPIRDAGDVDGQPFLAVAYVAGRTVAERIGQ